MHVLLLSHGTGLFEHGVPSESDVSFIEYGMSQYPKPEEVRFQCVYVGTCN